MNKLLIIQFWSSLILITGAESIQERFKATEKVLLDQGKSIRKLEHENYQLKTSMNSFKHENNNLKLSIQKLESEYAGLKTTMYDLESRCEELSANVKHLEQNEISATEGKSGLEVTPSSNISNQQFSGAAMDMLADNTNASYLPERLRLNALKRQSAESADVAFHVYLSANKCYNDHEVIDYDIEELDVGNGYRPDGIYIVPGSGVYVFTWTTIAAFDEFIVTEIVRNGESKGMIVSDSSAQSQFVNTSTGLVVIFVQKGDHIFIRRTDGRRCITVSNSTRGRTTFSGWRIFE